MHDFDSGQEEKQNKLDNEVDIMEDWMIIGILGIVATVGLGIMAYMSKKPAGRVIFSLLTIGVLVGTLWVVLPSIEIGEEPPPLIVEGAADWQMVSATETLTHVVPWGDDDYKVLGTFNDTSNLFEGATEFVQVAYRFQNFGGSDGSGVVCTITDYGNFYYETADDNYWIIEKYDQKFNSNWTIDVGAVAVNQIAQVTVPSDIQTKTGVLTLNLTGNADAMQYMIQSTDSAITILEFTNSITNTNIATIQYLWEKTTVTTK